MAVTIQARCLTSTNTKPARLLLEDGHGNKIVTTRDFSGLPREVTRAVRQFQRKYWTGWRVQTQFATWKGIEYHILTRRRT